MFGNGVQIIGMTIMGRANDGKAWVGVGDSAVRVVRGGSWLNFHSSAAVLRTATGSGPITGTTFWFSFSPVLTLFVRRPRVAVALADFVRHRRAQETLRAPKS